MLDREDWKGFSHFLDGPVWMDRQLVKALFSIGKEQWPSPISAIPEQELYRRLYPEGPFVAQRLRRVEMELRMALEQFLAQQESPLISPEWNHRLRTLQVLRRRGELAVLAKKVEENLRWLHEDAPFLQEYHLMEMWLYQLQGELAIQNLSILNPFSQVAHSLEMYYLHRKWENRMSVMFRNPHIGEAIPAEEWKPILEKLGTPISPIAEIWAQMILIHAHTAEANERLNQLLAENVSRIPTMTLRQIRGYQFNFLALNGNVGERGYYRQIWELIRLMVAEGTFFLENGSVSVPFYLQAVRASCLAGEWDWASKFQEKEGKRMTGNSVADYFAYGGLYISFWRGEYSTVWHSLLTIKVEDSKLDAFLRILQVQVAYHQERIEDYFRLLENLKKFLHRHDELGDRFLSMALEFVKLAEKLGHWRFSGNQDHSEILKMMEMAQPAEKLWLLQSLSTKK